MNTTTKTRHSEGCCKAFAKLDPACPRCQELAAGAPARGNWGRPSAYEATRRIGWSRMNTQATLVAR